jgi:hypothetical protein
MVTKEKIDSLLSELPSFYANNQAAADELFSVAVELGIRISRGCKDCIGRAYYAILRIKRDNYNMAKGDTYLFHDKVHSYRLPNTSKALTNNNSTVEERKAVYDSSINRRSLFNMATVPDGDVQLVSVPKQESKKEENIITTKRVSTKKTK